MDAGLRGNSASESTASIPSWVRSLEYVRVWKLPFYPAPIFEGTLTEGQTHFWLKVSRQVDIVKARGLKEVPGGERMSSAGVARACSHSSPRAQPGPWPQSCWEFWGRHRPPGEEVSLPHQFYSSAPGSFLDLGPCPSPIPGTAPFTISVTGKKWAQRLQIPSRVRTAFRWHYKTLCMCFLEICTRLMPYFRSFGECSQIFGIKDSSRKQTIHLSRTYFLYFMLISFSVNYTQFDFCKGMGVCKQ